MNKQWWNQYVGIPYVDRGRDRSGIDCWGLLRLVQLEQFGVELPSFADHYERGDDYPSIRKAVREAIAREREEWLRVEGEPQPGDGVLFNIRGEPVHIGVAIGAGMFLHARRGHGVVVERLAAGSWRHRVEGFYRPAAPRPGVSVSAVPHPLQTRRLEVQLRPGMTLAEVARAVELSGQVDTKLPYEHVFMVDGKVIPREQHDSLVTHPGQRIEYRAVPRGQMGNVIMMIAVLVVAWYAAPAILGGAAGSAGWAAAAAAGTTMSVALAAGAIASAGMLLTQSIFPTRMPSTPVADSPTEQYSLNGGQNRLTPYSPIPVVLGRSRFTPPVGALPYNESIGSTNYLRMVLVWGYGPLQISDLRIGDTPLEKMEEVEHVTLNGWDDTTEERKHFDRLYGKDVAQEAVNVELDCPTTDVSSATRSGTTVTVNTSAAHGLSTGAFVYLDDFDKTSGTITVVDADTFTIQQTGERHGDELAPPITAGIWTFTPGTGWSVGDTEFMFMVGAITHFPGTGSGTTFLSLFPGSPSDIPVTAGFKYRVSVQVAGGVSGTGFRAKIGGTFSPYMTEGGTHVFELTAVDSTGFAFEAGETTSGSIIGVSVRRTYVVGAADGALSGISTVVGSDWTTRTIADQSDRITVTLNFPRGLYKTAVEGSNAGSISETAFRGQIQVRQLDSGTLAPLEDWGDVAERFRGRTLRVQPAWFNVDSDSALEKVYRWNRISLDEHNKIVMREGALTQDPNANPTGNLLLRQQQAAFGVGEVYERLPAYVEGEEPLWDVLVFGDSISQVVDRRGIGTGGVTGCGLTYTNAKENLVVAAGTVTRAQAETISIGNAGQAYARRKEAFTLNISFDVPAGVYEVRARRTNTSEEDFDFPSGNAGKRMHTCVLVGITGFENRKPVVAPPGTKLAMTALRIKATNQVNGSLDGITGTVQTICKDWDAATSTWILRPTRNPASLIRHVLQHPGNAKRQPDSAINLEELQDFHEYCAANGFMYDQVRISARSVLDTIRDIAAAGRASPTQRDGKWTVVVDKPRDTWVQAFTPHNSWGFEGAVVLPKIPHGFRVKFNNALKGYQPDEQVVYADGYSAANATLFETLEFPGVSHPDQVFRHGRFHLAQLKLRPQIYTLNADIEHLICTRGDWVKCTHDVPMWGLGSGRIKERVSPTQLVLDEPVPMDAGKQYTIKVRLNESGQFRTRTVAAKAADGWYDTIDLEATAGNDLTSVEGEAGNLFMFGELTSESVDLVVLSIEPAGNMTAQLKLADYSPAIYDSDTEVIPPFDSQITEPPLLQQRTIKYAPDLSTSNIISDERVMRKVGQNQFEYCIKVPFKNPWGNARSNLVYVEAQIEWAEDKSVNWSAPATFRVSQGYALFEGVQEGDEYRIRMRYVDRQGRTGPWSAVVKHTVVGKKNRPRSVTGATITPSVTRLFVNWADNTEPDIQGYEVRTSDADWGAGATANRVFRGLNSQCYLPVPTVGTKTYYIKAYDVAGNFSLLATPVVYVRPTPAAPTGLGYTVSDTSTTTAQVTLNWADATPVFGLSHYKCTLTLPGGSQRTFNAKASEWTTSMNWSGTATLEVRVVDLLGIVGDPATLNVTKSVPNTVGALTKSAWRRNLTIDWANVARTTLPLAGYEVRTTDSGWGTDGFKYRGLASKAVVSMDPGANTFYVRAFDTDGRYSAASASVSHTWDIPPSATSLAATRVRGDIKATATVPSVPADLLHFEFRVKRGVTTGDVWTTGYDDVYRSQTAVVKWRPTQLGTYRIAVRMVDQEGNVAVASALTNITISQIPAP